MDSGTELYKIIPNTNIYQDYTKIIPILDLIIPILELYLYWTTVFKSGNHTLKKK